jgi:hypothetical protein
MHVCMYVYMYVRMQACVRVPALAVVTYVPRYERIERQAPRAPAPFVVEFSSAL